MDNAKLCASCATVLKEFISSTEERAPSEDTQQAAEAVTGKAQYMSDLWIRNIERLMESASMSMRQYFWTKEDAVLFANAKPKLVASLLTTTIERWGAAQSEACFVEIVTNTSGARETLQKWASGSLST